MRPLGHGSLVTRPKHCSRSSCETTQYLHRCSAGEWYCVYITGLSHANYLQGKAYEHALVLPGYGIDTMHVHQLLIQHATQAPHLAAWQASKSDGSISWLLMLSATTHGD